MLLWFNKDKPDAEGSEKKKETGTEPETLIFSETTAVRQKVPDKRTKLTDMFSRQTSTQELATQGTVNIVKNYRTYMYAFGKRFIQRY